MVVFMINKHIEIVCSTEIVLSSMSRESRDAIAAVLSQHYDNVGITIVNNLSDLEALVERKPDLVFLGMKFIPRNPMLGLQDPDKIWLNQYLGEHEIVCTGSSYLAHELELNKPLAKQCAIDAGLNTSQFYVSRQNQPQTIEDITLTFPLFIKPTNRGGGLGVDMNSMVHNFEQLQSKVRSITTDFQSDSLIEEYLPGREFSVAILKDEHSDKFSVMPIELVAQPDKRGIRLLSGAVKSSNTEIVLAVTDKAIRSKVCALAMDVFHALGARDYGRIDIRLDESGTPQFLEANLIPSLISGYGSFPKACVLNIDMDYEPMILSIVRLAFARELKVEQNYPIPSQENGIAMPSLEPAFGI